jgi:hypothetical protein
MDPFTSMMWWLALALLMAALGLAVFRMMEQLYDYWRQEDRRRQQEALGRAVEKARQ